MKEKELISLSPAQQRAFEELIRAVSAGDVLLLKGRPCSGRTTILQSLRDATSGALVGTRQLMDALAAGHSFAIEEAFLRMIEQALATNDVVIVDDLHLVSQVTDNCDYPRAYLLDAALTALIGCAAALKKKLVFATDGYAPWPILRRALTCEIGEFGPEDYRAICEGLLSEDQGRLDYARVHRIAPGLTAQQLRNTCNWLSCHGTLDTDSFIEYLLSHDMTSNVELEEVERGTWSDLKGVDGLVQELDAKMARDQDVDVGMATGFVLMLLVLSTGEFLSATRNVPNVVS